MNPPDNRPELLEKLRDPKFASDYVNEKLEKFHRRAFLVALRDVVDAHGGIGKLAKEMPLPRQTLYKVLSGQGNPTFEILLQIIQRLGLHMSVGSSAGPS